jgi:hypothetical protein
MNNDIFAVQSYERRTDSTLVELFGLVGNQADLILWRIVSELRSRHKSTKAWGSFLQKLRDEDSEQSICLISQPVLNRYALAGNFCRKNKISELRGVNKESIYMLSRLDDDDSASKIYNAIKDKGRSINEVKRLISTETDKQFTVATIERKPERMNTDHPTPTRYVPVINNQAIETPVQALIEPPAPILERPGQEMAESAANSLMLQVIADDLRAEIENQTIESLYLSPPKLPNHDEKVKWVIDLCKSWNDNFMESRAILKDADRIFAAAGYGK